MMPSLFVMEAVPKKISSISSTWLTAAFQIFPTTPALSRTPFSPRCLHGLPCDGEGVLSRLHIDQGAVQEILGPSVAELPWLPHLQLKLWLVSVDESI